jgi:hypothetical protein
MSLESVPTTPGQRARLPERSAIFKLQSQSKCDRPASLLWIGSNLAAAHHKHSFTHTTLHLAAMAGLVNTARLSARAAGRYANNHVARRGEELSA